MLGDRGIGKNSNECQISQIRAYIYKWICVICGNMRVNICKHICQYEVLMAEGKGQQQQRPQTIEFGHATPHIVYIVCSMYVCMSVCMLTIDKT